MQRLLVVRLSGLVVHGARRAQARRYRQELPMLGAAARVADLGHAGPVPRAIAMHARRLVVVMRVLAPACDRTRYVRGSHDAACTTVGEYLACGTMY